MQFVQLLLHCREVRGGDVADLDTIFVGAEREAGQQPDVVNPEPEIAATPNEGQPIDIRPRVMAVPRGTATCGGISAMSS